MVIVGIIIVLAVIVTFLNDRDRAKRDANKHKYNQVNAAKTNVCLEKEIYEKNLRESSSKEAAFEKTVKEMKLRGYAPKINLDGKFGTYDLKRADSRLVQKRKWEAKFDGLEPTDDNVYRDWPCGDIEIEADLLRISRKEMARKVGSLYDFPRMGMCKVVAVVNAKKGRGCVDYVFENLETGKTFRNDVCCDYDQTRWYG